MTPAGMLAVLDDAIAQAPTGGRRARRAIALELRTRTVLGHEGVFLGRDIDDHGHDVGPRYGYTRSQCVEIRQAILDAAAADGGLHG